MIKRLVTLRSDNDVIRVETRRLQARITSQDVSTLTTAEIHHSINRQLQQWLEIYLHTNRDGTWAIALGNEPEVWPEDER